MWNIKGINLIVSKLFLATNLYFKYKRCLQKVLKKKKRTVKERQNITKVVMKVLMSKLDEMIDRQGVPSHKEKGSWNVCH